MARRYPLPDGLAGLLRQAREDLGLTQADIGGTVNRSQPHISYFELGWGKTSAHVLDQWAAGLGCRWALIPLEVGDAQD